MNLTIKEAEIRRHTHDLLIELEKRKLNTNEGLSICSNLILILILQNHISPQKSLQTLASIRSSIESELVKFWKQKKKPKLKIVPENLA